MGAYEEKLENEREELLDRLTTCNAGSETYQQTLEQLERIDDLYQRTVNNNIERLKIDNEIGKIEADLKASRRLLWGNVLKVGGDILKAAIGVVAFGGFMAQTEKYEQDNVYSSTSSKALIRKGTDFLKF